jgi:hypothetical protein
MGEGVLMTEVTGAVAAAVVVVVVGVTVAVVVVVVEGSGFMLIGSM